MGIQHRATWAVALAATALVALTACTTGPGGGSTAASTTTASPTATPSRSATASADRVEFGDRRTGPQAPSCDVLLPSALVTAAVPTAAAIDVLSVPHVLGGTFLVPTLGGVLCESTNGVTSLDDVSPGRQGDPMYQGVRLTVLPDAAPEFAGSQSAQLRPGASETPACQASDAARVACHGDVLVGDAWVELFLDRVQDSQDATPEGTLPAFRALLDHAAAAVRSSAVSAVSTDHAAADTTRTTCTSENVDDVTDQPLADPFSFPIDVDPTTAESALGRLGAAVCSYAPDRQPNESSLLFPAAYSLLPDAGWVVEQRLAARVVDRSDRLDLDGLGAGDGAWRTCDDTACSVDVVHGGDWSHWVLYRAVAPDTSAAVERWVRASFTT